MTDREMYRTASLLFERLIKARELKFGVRLSPREVEVVTLIMDGALQLWGQEMEGPDAQDYD